MSDYDYNVTGEIYMESTGQSAEFDIDMEWDGEHEPNAMDVLHWLMQTGDLQIIPGAVAYIGADDEDDDE